MSSVLKLRSDVPDKFPEPPLRGDVITPDRYTSVDYARRELDRVWMRTRYLGGMAYQAPAPGDWITCEFGCCWFARRI